MSIRAYPKESDLYFAGAEPVLAERPGTTYTSIIWGMAGGDQHLPPLISMIMPCHDHYNFGADRRQR